MLKVNRQKMIFYVIDPSKLPYIHLFQFLKCEGGLFLSLLYLQEGEDSGGVQPLPGVKDLIIIIDYIWLF